MWKSASLAAVFSAVLAASTAAWASPIGLSGNPYPPATGGGRPSARTIPQTVNPPLMYDPHEDLYEWKIKDHPNDPCYYDEYYAQWVGDCNLYQTAPGYSITVPNQIHR